MKRIVVSRANVARLLRKVAALEAKLGHRPVVRVSFSVYPGRDVLRDRPDIRAENGALRRMTEPEWEMYKALRKYVDLKTVEIA